MYDLTHIPSEDYEMYEDDFEEVIEAKEDKSELKEVMDNYKRVLQGKINVKEEITPVRHEEPEQV